ncbi:uncharacterized protein RAG0_08929 [Rhynchosporium agropyri]|uniref:Uncharacterized protein n=1 Tax=Rhynchosporium agropyri TaxID=914238 RepID=A0A1E1KT33_9HELO|nr:uncharacterized protein RAG0_08929 [Rhynchosporium agropyri]
MTLVQRQKAFVITQNSFRIKKGNFWMIWLCGYIKNRDNLGSNTAAL